MVPSPGGLQLELDRNGSFTFLWLVGKSEGGEGLWFTFPKRERNKSHYNQDIIINSFTNAPTSCEIWGCVCHTMLSTSVNKTFVQLTFFSSKKKKKPFQKLKAFTREKGSQLFSHMKFFFAYFISLLCSESLARLIFPS